jgi:hypothetical protein
LQFIEVNFITRQPTIREENVKHSRVRVVKICYLPSLSLHSMFHNKKQEITKLKSSNFYYLLVGFSLLLLSVTSAIAQNLLCQDTTTQGTTRQLNSHEFAGKIFIDGRKAKDVIVKVLMIMSVYHNVRQKIIESLFLPQIAKSIILFNLRERNLLLKE